VSVTVLPSRANRAVPYAAYGMTYGKATMLKTTVYFPDELKRRIEYTAQIERKSEAEIIRAAVDAYTLHTNPPRPKFPLFSSGKPIEDWVEAMRGFGED
jgi:hypothetical protein